MNHDAEEIELPVGPLRLAARVHGPADGVPVLALHGWLDNAASFEPLAPLLDGIRLVALDLPGHGHSDHRPAGCHYHFIDYVHDVLGAADALGWERFALLGHSLGGAVATFVAGACPDRITRLTLIEALGPLTEHPNETPRRLAHALDRARVRSDRPARTYPAIEQAIEARRMAGGLDEPAARLLVERATLAVDGGVRWRSDRRLRLPAPYRFTEDQVVAVLRGIRAPTRLVVGDRGLLPMERPALEQRVEAIDDLAIDRLEGHHHLHMETPRPVADALGPFLARG
ncbi:alpha/beta fold hydrolase [Halofilum ochraceum]|uniref:alpha/beta fold hydrolase n=1 Tax=Halofilum ochraceum TaxID=1611323 RepID=UPI0008358D19|nr:alpha/beta hydrolase [Halofilum ochraceum]